MFGRSGYRKASTADIAEAAGIAKGMVFYYFGSKKNLYLYLIELCGKEMTAEMDARLDKTVTDFFDRIKMMTDIKIALIKRHPNAITFITGVYYEDDPEVRGEIDAFIAGSTHLRGQMIFDATDVSRFKDDIDPAGLTDFLTWAGEGFARNLPVEGVLECIDHFTGEFYKCLDIMKKYFYKGDHDGGTEP